MFKVVLVIPIVLLAATTMTTAEFAQQQPGWNEAGRRDSRKRNMTLRPALATQTNATIMDTEINHRDFVWDLRPPMS